MRLCSALLAASLALAPPASAWAQAEHAPPPPDPDALPAPPVPAPEPEAAPAPFRFTAGAASRYVFRGVDLSDANGQVFAGASYTRGGFYAGAWASSVDLRRLGGRSGGAEVDAFGGWRTELGGYALDLGAIAYAFAGQPDRFSFGEAYAKASRAIGPVTLGGAVYLSPQFRGREGFGAYAELNAAYALTRKLTFSGAVGRQTLSRTADDTSWNLGATYALTDRLGVDFRYADTDAHGLGRPYGSKLVASVRASFP